MPRITVDKDGNRHRAVWTGLTTAGNANIQRYTPKASMGVATVQVSGTFGGATVAMQGSNDGTNFIALRDLNGQAISFTAAGYAEFSTGFVFVRPQVSGGTGDNIAVTVAHWN